MISGSPAGKVVHVILDNYVPHEHASVMARLARHLRWTFHFMPTSCSWLNAVETFCSRGVFRSIVDPREHRDPKRSPGWL